jgi:hypothetical protein
LKDEPKWIELKRMMDEKPRTSSARDATTQDSNSSTTPLDVSSPGSSTRKHPMRRDAAKAERKKVTSASMGGAKGWAEWATTHPEIGENTHF